MNSNEFLKWIDRIYLHTISDIKLLQHLLNSTPIMRNYDLVWIDNEYMQLLLHGQDERDYVPLKCWSVRHFRSVVFRKWEKEENFKRKGKAFEMCCLWSFLFVMTLIHSNVDPKIYLIYNFIDKVFPTSRYWTKKFGVNSYGSLYKAILRWAPSISKLVYFNSWNT